MSLAAAVPHTDTDTIVCRRRVAWAEQAACAGMDVNTFIHDGTTAGLEALQTCRRCPVRQQCLRDALNGPPDDDTIRGGLLPSHRRAIRQRRYTTADAYRRVEQILNPPPAPPPPPERDTFERCDVPQQLASNIIGVVARDHKIPVDVLLSGNRQRPVTAARADACVRLRNLGMSYPAIGKALDLDHTTVIHHVRRRDVLHTDRTGKPVRVLVGVAVLPTATPSGTHAQAALAREATPTISP